MKICTKIDNLYGVDTMIHPSVEWCSHGSCAGPRTRMMPD